MKKPRSLLTRVTIAFLSVLLFLGVMLLVADRLLPQVYFAKITMEVKSDNSGPISVFGGSSHSGLNPQFFERQFQILRSPEILNQAIENLKLTEVWSARETRTITPQKALKRLLEAMELREVPKTGLIEVGVYSPDPQEAANIANTIAVVYQEKLLGELQKRVDRGMEQLKDEVEKQRKRAEEALAEATAIKERDGIIDPDPDEKGLSGPSAPNNVDLRPYLEAKARALQAKRIYEAAQTKYATELLQRGMDFDPAKIWEKAEPPAKPTHFCLYRLRYAFDRYFAR